MAQIIDNKKGRRLIRLNTSDILDIVREYQNITYKAKNYLDIREKLNNIELFIPEDVI